MENHNQPVQVKLVVVGDGTVGKTCILISYTKDQFPQGYVPTIFDNYASTLKVDGRLVNLSLWDTAGQDAFDRLRLLSYPNTDVFLIVFAVDEESTFVNARKKWFNEVKDHVPNVPKIFVGNKIDLRGRQQGIKSKQYFEKILEEETMCKYIECSALTQEGLKEVFDEAMRMVIKSKAKPAIMKKKQEKSGCALI